MKVVVSGASGFIGSALVPALRAAGHEVLSLVRREPGPGEVRWDPSRATIDAAALTGVEAGIHLAGAGIGDKRWTDAYKRTVLESRMRSTDLLARTLADVGATAMLSGSAIGFYGDAGDATVDERSPAGTGFLADVCVQWEAATAPAEQAGLRVVHLRTGIVLDRSGGALKQQLPLYKLGIGGPLGSGRQWQSWISLADEVRAILWLLTADVRGPVDLTAPEPVRQRDFAKALASALHRPSVVPTPGFALKLVLGGFAGEGVLAGQRVLPTVLQDGGFTWSAPAIDAGIAAALSG